MLSNEILYIAKTFLCYEIAIREYLLLLLTARRVHAVHVSCLKIIRWNLRGTISISSEHVMSLIYIIQKYCRCLKIPMLEFDSFYSPHPFVWNGIRTCRFKSFRKLFSDRRICSLPLFDKNIWYVGFFFVNWRHFYWAQ